MVASPLLAGAVASLLALGGCSSEPGARERAGATEEAVGSCKPGYERECFDPDEGKPVCLCVRTTFYDVVTPADPQAVCGGNDVPAPSALAAYGCSTGVLIEGQPVWACPEGTPVPSSLGLVTAPYAPKGTCAMNGAGVPDLAELPCESVIGFTQGDGPCVGPAPTGWMYILDTEWIAAHSTAGDTPVLSSFRKQFFDVATPAADSAVCSRVSGPVPGGLAAYGCTDGVYIDGRPAWACPTGTRVPLLLGVTAARSCVFGADGTLSERQKFPCELVFGSTKGVQSCMGPAPDGWIYIVDGGLTYKSDGTGGCPGQCPEELPEE
jgi:hypothetical protein